MNWDLQEASINNNCKDSNIVLFTILRSHNSLRRGPTNNSVVSNLSTVLYCFVPIKHCFSAVNAWCAVLRNKPRRRLIEQERTLEKFSWGLYIWTGESSVTNLACTADVFIGERTLCNSFPKWLVANVRICKQIVVTRRNGGSLLISLPTSWRRIYSIVER